MFPEDFVEIGWTEVGEKGVTDGQTDRHTVVIELPVAAKNMKGAFHLYAYDRILVIGIEYIFYFQ